MRHRSYEDCPFWTGIEYQGLYKCSKDNTICYGCNYNSRHWYKRMHFDISTDFILWYHYVFLAKIDKIKRCLFDIKYNILSWISKKRKGIE